MIARAILVAMALCVSGPALGQTSDAMLTGVELVVSGPPIDASETGQEGVYTEPYVPKGLAEQFGVSVDVSGIVAQDWSRLGREDRGAASGSDEYTASPCKILRGSTQGLPAILDTIAKDAAKTRIVIVNESHEVTLHRDFSRRVIERLRSQGYTVFAAETFSNRTDEADPVEESAALPYPKSSDGHYINETVFGELVRTAKRLGYRLAAYEEVSDPTQEQPKGLDEQIAQREEAQARNLAAHFKSLKPYEKLVVHVGYSHAREIQKTRVDGFDLTWMAGRLKRYTGVDPLTIEQTYCRGSSDIMQLSEAPKRVKGWFDLHVDHPVHDFRYGRSDWRFTDGARAIAIPELFASAKEALIIEAFADGEPFEAVPVDRVWIDPGEDVKLVLKPGRYTVRAVRPNRPPAD